MKKIIAGLLLLSIPLFAGTVSYQTGGTGSVVLYQGAGSSANFASNEIPSGSINGSNTAFTLAHTPTSGSLLLMLNGLGQLNATDYTLSGTSLSYNIAPSTGSNLTAYYRY